MKNKTCGIYLITEKATGKMYVGLAKRRDGIEGRWYDHKKRFPQDLFTYEILLPCPPGTTREELSNLEKFYIRELDCVEPNGFNKTSGGCGKTELSEEQKAKRRGRVHSKKTRDKMSATRKGRAPHNKGKPMSEETKAKQSAAQKGKSKNKGRVCSEEERAKRSAALKGRVCSEETRAKISAALKRRVSPPKRNPLSEETKAKLSAARKAVAARKRAAKAAAVAALEALLTAEIISTSE